MSKFIIPVIDEFGNKVYFQTSPHKGQESVDGYTAVVMWLEKNGFKVGSPKEITAEPVDNKHCVTCGNPLTYKEGISKSGKPWKGYFCSERGHEPQWVK